MLTIFLYISSYSMYELHKLVLIRINTIAHSSKFECVDRWWKWLYNVQIHLVGAFCDIGNNTISILYNHEWELLGFR